MGTMSLASRLCVSLNLLVLVTGLSLVYGIGRVNAVTCGNTSVWYNNSHPSAANNYTDTEPPPSSDELDKVCGGSVGGQLVARCKDERGEPFTGLRNESRSLFYVATCVYVTGLQCSPYDGHNSSCPDFAIQFTCDCPQTTTAAPVTRLATVISVIKPQTATGSGSSATGNNIQNSVTSGPTGHVSTSFVNGSGDTSTGSGPMWTGNNTSGSGANTTWSDSSSSGSAMSEYSTLRIGISSTIETGSTSKADGLQATETGSSGLGTGSGGRAGQQSGGSGNGGSGKSLGLVSLLFSLVFLIIVQ